LLGGRPRLSRSRAARGRNRWSKRGGGPAAGGHPGVADPARRLGQQRGPGHARCARRRLGVIRDVLHTLSTQQFGRRGGDGKPLAPAERYRQVLGLPPGRRLSGPEIHQAYKRAAKRAHPDAGGNARDFQELSAARDALMKER
jgi:hypothetical protein